MKKILLGCMMLTFSVHGLSQESEPIFSLASIEASDGLEFEKFTYNDDNLLIATEILTSDGISAIDSLVYNESNQIIQLNTYQLIDTNYVHVSYINYTYDANGNRTSRANYNSFGGSDFELGGIYQYTYENNVRTGWELIFVGNVIERAILSYNADGKLTAETVQSGWGNGPFENSWRLRYVYNDNGTLDRIYSDFWNGSSWDTSTSDVFSYDENGNCTDWIYYNGTEIFNRYEYEYDLNYTTNQIVYPYSPEDDIATKSMVEKNNKVLLSHWYTQNDNAELIYVCDYIYNYNVLEEMATNNPGAIHSEVLVYPNPASDYVTFSAGESTIKGLDITTSTGQVVWKNSNIHQKDFNLNVSGLNAGVYFARIQTSKGMVMKKFIVK
jgi:hypothetical protein